MSHKHRITVLAGDGIGPEVMDASLTVLEAISKKFSLNFIKDSQLVGGGGCN